MIDSNEISMELSSVHHSLNAGPLFSFIGPDRRLAIRRLACLRPHYVSILYDSLHQSSGNCLSLQ